LTFNVLFLSCNRDCAKLLVHFHTAAAESKLKAVYKKFSSADRGAVALLTPAREAFHLNRHEKVLVTFG
jgi:hypothetical protein